MSDGADGKMLEALLWAWCNVTGVSPDQNTMTEAEVADYWDRYGNLVRSAIVARTGMEPNDYLRTRIGEKK